VSFQEVVHSVLTEDAEVAEASSLRPPWSVEELDASFVVCDADGPPLGYFYYEGEPGRSAAKLLSEDEAWRIAANFAKCRRYCARRDTMPLQKVMAFAEKLRLGDTATVLSP
jgi:hypothetical protein